MTTIHLLQLRHQDAETFDSKDHREVLPGSLLTILEHRGHRLDVAECSYGLACGERRGSQGIGDADRLTLAERAVWATQRCLIPIVGFRTLDPSKGKWVRWVPTAGALAYVPALRYSTMYSEGRRAECRLLVRSVPPGGLLPVAITDITPGQWLALEGTKALAALSTHWRSL